MSLTALATIFAQSMDPTDLVDYEIDLTGKLLEPAEAADSYTLTAVVEAVALGFTIAEGVADLGDAAYAPAMSGGETILFWVYVDEAFRSNVAYEAGLTAGIELTVETNSTPPRRRQRSFGIKVVQQ